MATQILTQERLKQLLSYDPLTGVFSRLKKCGGVFKNHYAGHINVLGYVVVQVDGRKYYAHRLIWLYTHGVWPQEVIDHKNGCTSDNRLDNLREASAKENCHNTKAYANNTSGRMGVTWVKRKNKWQAQIAISGVNTYLGVFDSIDAAIASRCAAELIHQPFRAARNGTTD